jgi:hypothetical protein
VPLPESTTDWSSVSPKADAGDASEIVVATTAIAQKTVFAKLFFFIFPPSLSSAVYSSAFER